MQIHRFTLADLPATPWKNGGGSTTEIWCEPPGAGLDDFVWRVSVATIASDGPFSVFNGVDRVMMLLQGSGVYLSSPDGALLTELDTPLRPYAFAGETPVMARRMGGNSLDFNVMSRRGKATAQVQVLRHPVTAPSVMTARDGLVFCVAPEMTPAQNQVDVWRGQALGRQDVETLVPGQGFYWSFTADQADPSDPLDPLDRGHSSPPGWQWHSAAGSDLLLVSFSRKANPID